MARGAGTVARGYKRMILEAFVGGVATFPSCIPFKGALPELSRELGMGEAQAALAVSAATLGACLLGARLVFGSRSAGAPTHHEYCHDWRGSLGS